MSRSRSASYSSFDLEVGARSTSTSTSTGMTEFSNGGEEDARKDAVAPELPSNCRVVIAMMALMLGALSSGTYEFLLTGMYERAEDSWNLTSAETTQATTVFMIVASAAPLIFSFVPAHWSRKAQFSLCQAVLASCAAASALAPEFWILLLARGVAAAAHSQYTALGISAAISFRPPKMANKMASYFLGGWAAANIGGIPFSTYLGEVLSNWQQAYWPVAGLSASVAILLPFVLPAKTVIPGEVKLCDKWGVLRKPSVWGALTVAALGYGGVFGCHTFYDWVMTNLAGYAQDDMVWLAFGWGLAVTVGNYLGGPLADKSTPLALFFLMPLLAAVLGTFAVLAKNKIAATICLNLNGLVGFLMVAPLFSYIREKTLKGEELTPAVVGAQAGFAAALGMSVLGLGILLAVGLSQVTIANDLGYESANWVGASLTAVAWIIYMATECKSVLAEFKKCTCAKNPTSKLEVAENLLKKKKRPVTCTTVDQVGAP